MAAIDAGADAIGLVFYPPSPRAVTPEQAFDIVQGLPPFVTKVGLFVDAKGDDINRAIELVELDLLQFHGDETQEACCGFNRPYMKALRMKQGLNLIAQGDLYFDAAGLLLDTYQKGVPGGTGAVFNWDLIPDALASSIVLAGGLSAENISQAIQQVKPYAVDVSGGVEREKGIKSARKINDFMRNVQQAEQLAE